MPTVTEPFVFTTYGADGILNPYDNTYRWTAEIIDVYKNVVEGALIFGGQPLNTAAPDNATTWSNYDQFLGGDGLGVDYRIAPGGEKWLSGTAPTELASDKSKFTTTLNVVNGVINGSFGNDAPPELSGFELIATPTESGSPLRITSWTWSTNVVPGSPNYAPPEFGI